MFLKTTVFFPCTKVSHKLLALLRNHNINEGSTWYNLQICGLFLSVTPLILVTFPRNLVHTFKRDLFARAWKKIFIAVILLN